MESCDRQMEGGEAYGVGEALGLQLLVLEGLLQSQDLRLVLLHRQLHRLARLGAPLLRTKPAGEERRSSSIIIHFMEKLLHQQQGEVLISVSSRVTTSSVFYQLPSPPRLHRLRKYPHISQNTFGETLENLPKLLRVCGQKLRGGDILSRRRQTEPAEL